MKTLLFLLVVFGSNVIQAITGFAGTMLAMPPSCLLIGVDQARAILNVLGLLSSLFILVRDYRYVDLHELKKISIGMGGGILIGLILLKTVEMPALLTAYGLLIVAIALIRLSGRRTAALPDWACWPMLAAAGVIHGMFISGGSLLMVYAAAALPEKRSFRATLSAVWVLLNSFLMFSHVRSGLFHTGTWLMLLYCIIPLIFAIRLGTWLHKRVKQSSFLKLTYFLLLISGIFIIVP